MEILAGEQTDQAEAAGLVDAEGAWQFGAVPELAMAEGEHGPAPSRVLDGIRIRQDGFVGLARSKHGHLGRTAEDSFKGRQACRIWDCATTPVTCLDQVTTRW